MELIQNVVLGNTNYYIKLNLEYKKKNNVTHLCLKNSANDYYDGGDLSILIKKVENNYKNIDINKYGKDILYLANCLYIYECIPIISFVGDIYYKENNLKSMSMISVKELLDYAKDNNIILKDNKNFKLGDERTWNL